MRKAQWLGTRWLGVGLAAVLAVVTISLAVTGRLGLYINPDSTWFAVSMAVVVLIGTVASFALPLGAEADHGHDHGDPSHAHSSHAHSSHAHSSHAPAPALSSALSPARPPATSSASRQDTPDDRRGLRRVLASQGMGDAVEGQGHGSAGEHVHHTPHPLSVAATVVGGVAASGVVLLTLVLPPASLSAELAMSRDVGATPLFGGADTIQLASTGDTGSFGVGEWATVFATSTNPDAFEGDTIELTGFVTPGDDDAFDLTRLVITHCVIDAQPASLPIVAADIPATGQWVTISGTVRSSSDGRLVVDAESVEEIAEPEDPYEY